MTAPERAADLPAPDLDLVVDPEADLLRVRDARAEQHLRRLVRGVPAAAAARGHGRAAAYDDFLDWAASPFVVGLNVVAAVFLVLHVVTWFSLTPQAMAVRVRGRPVPPVAIIGAQYAGLAVVSAFVVWLVTR